MSITTGIFTWIAAHAAAEGQAAGETKTTPYWRTLKTSGEINPKYPGGVLAQKRRLKIEGHRFERSGRRWLVAGFSEKLARVSGVSR